MRDLLPSRRWRLVEFGSRLHPTVKPVAVVADAILESNLRRDRVLDGFLGSGSTMIAAGRNRRGCYGLDHYSAPANVYLAKVHVIRIWKIGKKKPGQGRAECEQ